VKSVGAKEVLLRVPHYMTSGPGAQVRRTHFLEALINHLPGAMPLISGPSCTRAPGIMRLPVFPTGYGVHNRSASIHVEDLAGHPIDSSMQMSIVTFATSCGSQFAGGTHPISCQDLIACCTSGGETNQYTAIDQVSCTEDDAGLSSSRYTTPAGRREVAHQNSMALLPTHPHQGANSPTRPW